MNTTPNKVQHYREAKGLSRERLAADADVSYEYVRKLEAQQVPQPSLALTRRIADALGCTVDEAFPPAAATESAPAPVKG